MTKPDNRYGQVDFKEIGKLSSFWGAYVRQCCRALRDGTDTEVLQANRLVAYSVLSRYAERYTFAKRHMILFDTFAPSDVQEIIHANMGERNDMGCYATLNSVGLPKRACMHCPKVGLWIKTMNKIIDDGVPNYEEQTK